MSNEYLTKSSTAMIERLSGNLDNTPCSNAFVRTLASLEKPAPHRPTIRVKITPVETCGVGGLGVDAYKDTAEALVTALAADPVVGTIKVGEAQVFRKPMPSPSGLDTQALRWALR